MSNYDGAPNWDTVPLLSDGTVPTAAQHNVPLETVTDRTVFLRQSINQIQSLNFPVHPAQSSLGSLRSAAYDRAYRKWYVVGPTENVRVSSDGGHSWSSTSDIAAVGSNEDCFGIDFDGSGNAVVTTDTAYLFELTASTGTWTRPNLTGSVTPGLPMHAAYDPVHTKWCVIASNGGVTLTSTNRTSWTPGTPPASFTTMTNVDMRCNKTTGRLVLIGQTVSSTTLKVRTSDDGGATWTTRSDISISISPIDSVALVRDTNVANRWLIIVNRTSGGWNSEVWASTDDGVTFTRIKQLAFHALYRCAPCGDATLVGLSQNPSINRFEVVASLDGGVNWYPVGMTVAGNMRGAYAGAGGIALVTSSDVYIGARSGSPGFAALT